MTVFELSEMAGLIGMPLTKAKNWTIGRPLKLEPSIRTSTGTGSSNLYSLEDVYVWRPAGKLTFEVRKGEVRPPVGVLVWQTVSIAALVKRTNAAVRRLG